MYTSMGMWLHRHWAAVAIVSIAMLVEDTSAAYGRFPNRVTSNQNQPHSKLVSDKIRYDMGKFIKISKL